MNWSQLRKVRSLAKKTLGSMRTAPAGRLIEPALSGPAAAPAAEGAGRLRRMVDFLRNTPELLLMGGVFSVSPGAKAVYSEAPNEDRESRLSSHGRTGCPTMGPLPGVTGPWSTKGWETFEEVPLDWLYGLRVLLGDRRLLLAAFFSSILAWYVALSISLGFLGSNSERVLGPLPSTTAIPGAPMRSGRWGTGGRRPAVGVPTGHARGKKPFRPKSVLGALRISWSMVGSQKGRIWILSSSKVATP